MTFSKIKIQMIKEHNYSYNSRSISNSKEIVQFINSFEELEKETEEKMLLICLNNKNQIISFSEIAKGSINACYIDMKTIFKNVLLTNSSKIIMVHNHPSGNATPSKEDIKLTNKVKEACKLIDVILLDHIIIADENFESCMN